MAHREFRKEISGSDTVVLFIHGIQGSPDQFEFLYPAVPEDWSIVSLLLDGHGGAVKDFSRTSMKKWKAQIQAEADALAEKYDSIYVVGHSMGTFFAMDIARRFPEKAKGLLLLCVPLVIGMTLRASVNSMKVIFTSPPDKSQMTAAARAAYSIEPDRRLWRYMGWIPRYLELFAEARAQRKLILSLSTPCHVYQSARDELVSRRSKKYIASNPYIILANLPGSSHSFFTAEDMNTLSEALVDMCKNN